MSHDCESVQRAVGVQVRCPIRVVRRVDRVVDAHLEIGGRVGLSADLQRAAGHRLDHERRDRTVHVRFVPLRRQIGEGDLRLGVFLGRRDWVRKRRQGRWLVGFGQDHVAIAVVDAKDRVPDREDGAVVQVGGPVRVLERAR